MSEEHPRSVKRALQHLVVLVCALTIATGGLAECAGWQASAEARMACCVEGSCPMHTSAGHESDSTNSIDQAAADSCCASSESPNPTPTGPVFTMALPAATLVDQLFASLAPLTLPRDAGRGAVPVGSSPVAKHLLLSVFLI